MGDKAGGRMEIEKCKAARHSSLFRSFGLWQFEIEYFFLKKTRNKGIDCLAFEAIFSILLLFLSFMDKIHFRATCLILLIFLNDILVSLYLIVVSL